MSAYVLLTAEGKPYSESTIKRYFKIAKALAGITRCFPFPRPTPDLRQHPREQRHQQLPFNRRYNSIAP